MYTLNQLEMFKCVADSESFNKAAEALFVTPNAVMKQINNLEKELGVSLLERTHRGTKLTKAGEKFYEETSFILKYCRESVERVREAARTGGNIIRVGSSIMTPPEVLSDLWIKIRAEYPEVEFKMVPFDIIPDNAGLVFPTLGENADIVVSAFDEKSCEMGNYRGIEMMQVPFYCILSNNHRLAEMKEISFEDLCGETFLLINEGRSSCVDELRAFIKKNYPDIHIEKIDSYGIDVYNRCASGNEVMLGMGDLVQIHPLLRRVPLVYDKTTPFGILYPQHPSPLIKKVVAIAEKIVAEAKSR